MEREAGVAYLSVDGQDIPLAADGLPAGLPWEYGVATLGLGVLAWTEALLVQPDGPNAGQPWRWTRTQGRIVLWWFSVRRSGRWVFRQGQYVAVKSTGKSPMAAALACAELAGPVVFDRFDEHGEAVGKPHPSAHVQLAGVAGAQASNTFELALRMLADGPAMSEVDGLYPGLTLIRTRTGKLEKITSSADTRDGARITAAILDETHRWTPGDHLDQLAAVMGNNLVKTGGRPFQTTNPWAPGEDSVAEHTSDHVDAIRRGEAIDIGVMKVHPHVIVDDLSDDAEVAAALHVLLDDAPWVDQEDVAARRFDPSVTPAAFRRFWLGEVSAATSSWLTAPEWAACVDLDKTVDADDVITLGFDGSRGRAVGVADATALIGCRVSDGHLFQIGVWVQPDGPQGREWTVPEVEVRAAVAYAFSSWKVVGFACDPARWDPVIREWAAEFGPRMVCSFGGPTPLHYSMLGGRGVETARALERFRDAVLTRDITHDGSWVLTAHALNAREHNTPAGVQIRKPSPDRKIDAIVAAVLAREAALQAYAKGAHHVVVKPRSKRIYRF